MIYKNQRKKYLLLKHLSKWINCENIKWTGELQNRKLAIVVYQHQRLFIGHNSSYHLVAQINVFFFFLIQILPSKVFIFGPCDVMINISFFEEMLPHTKYKFKALILSQLLISWLFYFFFLLSLSSLWPISIVFFDNEACTKNRKKQHVNIFQKQMFN